MHMFAISKMLFYLESIQMWGLRCSGLTLVYGKVWGHLKGVELRNLCCFTIPHLRHELRDAVKWVRRKPHLVKAFLAHA
jgi:hypothetical protein